MVLAIYCILYITSYICDYICDYRCEKSVSYTYVHVKCTDHLSYLIPKVVFMRYTDITIGIRIRTEYYVYIGKQGKGFMYGSCFEPIILYKNDIWSSVPMLSNFDMQLSKR